jgi:NarL family two-component system response regulator LiaR
MKIRVLIVDDHTIVRQGLRLLMEAQTDMEVVGEAVGGREALIAMQDVQPDVVLLDLIMPGMSGLDVLRELQKRSSTSRVLVLTSSLDDHIVRQALQAGAQGYLLKTSRAGEMLDAIRQTAQGISALDSAVTRILQQHLTGKDPLNLLTAREREVFDLLAHGMNNPQIAEKLVISEATVRTHVTSVLDKLRLRDRTQVMVFALKRGLVTLQDLP